MTLRRLDAAPAEKPIKQLNGTLLGHRRPTSNPQENDKQSAPPAAERNWSLFLDFDGTLVDFAARPEDVVVDIGLRELLARLHQTMNGAIAIISGRQLVDLDRMIGLPFLPMAGQHGLEWRDSFGRVAKVDDEPLPPELIEAARRWCEGHDGARLEIKDFALAVHVRANPRLYGEALSLGRALVEEMPGKLMVQLGVQVVEIRRSGASKGSVVATMMRDEPFVGRMPVFVGDDRTDEDGFAEATRTGGFGLLVGPERPSIARHRLRRPAHLRLWLSHLIDGM